MFSVNVYLVENGLNDGAVLEGDGFWFGEFFRRRRLLVLWSLKVFVDESNWTSTFALTHFCYLVELESKFWVSLIQNTTQI